MGSFGNLETALFLQNPVITIGELIDGRNNIFHYCFEEDNSGAFFGLVSSKCQQ